MNIELLEYCLKGLRKRWKEVLRTSVVIFIAFTFVAGTLIFQSNMYKWQIQSAKSRFGSWYVMYEGSVKAENNDLKNHPYLGTAGLAQVHLVNMFRLKILLRASRQYLMVKWTNIQKLHSLM